MNSIGKRIIQLTLILLFALQLGLWSYVLKFPERINAASISKEFTLTNSQTVNLYGQDWLPPKVTINSPTKSMNFDRTEFSIFTNEAIISADIPAGWQLLYFQKFNGQYSYVLKTLPIADGEHDYTLKFADGVGNATTQKIHLTANSGRPVSPGWQDPLYFVDGDSSTALVNKEYRLPEDYAPSDIVSLNELGLANSHSAKVRKLIVPALQKMLHAISDAGINYVVTSGYRSFLDQYLTYNYWLRYYKGNVTSTDAVSARPGFSEHQLGTTIDIVTSENNYIFDHYADTKLAKWLDANAYKYGFVMSYPLGKTAITGYTYEPWHYRYVGVENALEIKNSGLTLIEWLKQFNGVK